MITFFTTTKNFSGKIAIAQINAIQSWLLSIKGAEAIVFGDCEGIESIAQSIKFTHQPDVNVSEQGTPYINDMFVQASQLANNAICCFINADIIVYNIFAESLLEIHNLAHEDYLVVGQRQDLTLNETLHFTSDWETRLREKIERKGCIHPPLGSDFFAFPTGQYHAGNMPDLLVGRGGWDLWMIYNGRQRALKVIDLSPHTMVVHQNHDYSHRKIIYESEMQDDETIHNYSLLPREALFDYTLFACNYLFKHGQIRRNFARGKLRTFLRYELHLRNQHPFYNILNRILRKLRFFPCDRKPKS